MMSYRCFVSALFLGFASVLLALTSPRPAAAAVGRSLEGLTFFDFNKTAHELAGKPKNVNGRKLLGVPLHLV